MLCLLVSPRNPFISTAVSATGHEARCKCSLLLGKIKHHKHQPYCHPQHLPHMAAVSPTSVFSSPFHTCRMPHFGVFRAWCLYGSHSHAHTRYPADYCARTECLVQRDTHVPFSPSKSRISPPVAGWAPCEISSFTEPFVGEFWAENRGS